MRLNISALSTLFLIKEKSPKVNILASTKPENMLFIVYLPESVNKNMMDLFSLFWFLERIKYFLSFQFCSPRLLPNVKSTKTSRRSEKHDNSLERMVMRMNS